MLICRVTGSVISTRKNEKLTGSRFLIVETLNPNAAGPPPEESGNGLEASPISNRSSRFIAVDNIGAGVGETVLVVCGSGARIACGNNDIPVDAAVVGIIDEGTQI